MYYNNTVCKIRYDLIRKSNNPSEDDIFDIYDNVFDSLEKDESMDNNEFCLQRGEIVTCMFPFISMNSNKLIYISQ
jgi:hypothetical protein